MAILVNDTGRHTGKGIHIYIYISGPQNVQIIHNNNNKTNKQQIK